MYDGWRENNWTIVSAVMALVANCHRDSKHPPFKPDMFNPCVDHSARVVSGAELDAMLKKYKR